MWGKGGGISVLVLYAFKYVTSQLSACAPSFYNAFLHRMLHLLICIEYESGLRLNLMQTEYVSFAEDLCRTNFNLCTC